jgi:hypothetical protein
MSRQTTPGNVADEPLPRVLALLTARHVEVHPVSNAPTIVNVTDHLVCSRLPTSAPLAIFASMDGAAGVVPVGLRVFSPDGALLHEFAATATFRDREHVVNLIRTADVELPVPGRYRVQVLARGMCCWNAD